MKALIIAALLAVTPVAATAAPMTLQEEVRVTAPICLKVALGKLSADEVIRGLNLDTPEKKREFALHCKLYLQGFEDAVQAQADREKGID